MSGSRVIVVRMAEAKAKMIARRRTPRAFFLGPDDYAEFCRTSPDYAWVKFHQLGKPSELFCPVFEKIAVRASAAKPLKPNGVYKSKLYCCVGTSVQVPVR